jgi:hypothetical protein
LVQMAREREGREASPSAGVIDSQSVKTTDILSVVAGDFAKFCSLFPESPFCAILVTCRRPLWHRRSSSVSHLALRTPRYATSSIRFPMSSE